jgi:hypothetical protein
MLADCINGIREASKCPESAFSTLGDAFGAAWSSRFVFRVPVPPHDE